MSKDNQNIYAERETEDMGEFYLRHVDRMTVEKLHEKSAIAAELGWRDMQIANLKEENETIASLQDVANKLAEAITRWLTAHDENMHLLNQGMLSPTDVKQAVADEIKGVRSALALHDSIGKPASGETSGGNKWARPDSNILKIVGKILRKNEFGAKSGAVAREVAAALGGAVQGGVA